MQSGLGTTGVDLSSSKINMFPLTFFPELQVTYQKAPCIPHRDIQQAAQTYHVK